MEKKNENKPKKKYTLCLTAFTEYIELTEEEFEARKKFYKMYRADVYHEESGKTTECWRSKSDKNQVLIFVEEIEVE